MEVQDGGSQMIALACAAAPGLTVVDLCAGAGGKTLALAAAMAGQGTLIAADTIRARLARLSPRAERAGATFIETLLIDQGHEGRGLDSLPGRMSWMLIDSHELSRGVSGISQTERLGGELAPPKHFVDEGIGKV